jgi:ribonuclease P/MRP protein subunit RPP1
MLYDLNIVWSPSSDPAELARTLKFSADLGYNVVALNCSVTPPFAPDIINPIPQLTTPCSYADVTAQLMQRKPLQLGDSCSTTPVSTLLSLRILRRATVTLSDPSQNYRLPNLAAAYDILAVRPTTEKAFQAVCVNLQELSIISLDLTAHYSFHFRPKPCMAAVSRGVRFEICYSQTIISGGDARSRSNFISNIVSLFRATKGRGIIISSEAKSALGLRAPADIINLMATWGLGTERGLDALSVTPRGIVVNEVLRRRGYKGVVDIVQVGVKTGRQDTKRAKEGDNISAVNTGREYEGQDDIHTNKRKSSLDDVANPRSLSSHPTKRQIKKQKNTRVQASKHNHLNRLPGK